MAAISIVAQAESIPTCTLAYPLTQHQVAHARQVLTSSLPIMSKVVLV